MKKILTYLLNKTTHKILKIVSLRLMMVVKYV